jgi:iron(III) transport system substrate-binding protein
MKRSRLPLLAAATLVALTTTACGGDSADTAAGPVTGSWNDVVAAAEKEGKVTLYSSQNPVNLEKLKAAFQAKYPKIALEFVRGTDAEMNPKVEVENRTGKGIADVHVLTDAGWITTDAASGAYSNKIVGPDFDSAGYERSKSVLSDRYFLTSAAVFAMGWNTDKQPNGFSDPQSMLKPELEGKIGITNPAGIAAYVDMYKFMTKNYGEDFLPKLAALKPRIYPSSLGIAQALTSGEIVATPVVQPLVKEEASGAPVAWKLPTPAWGAPWYGHVLKAAPHPNAAQVLADFMVTKAGQDAASGGYASALADTQDAIARAQDIALPDPAELTPEKNQAYQAEWEKLFTP